VAERRGLQLADIENRYNELERQMLDEFYRYVNNHVDYTWLHWNMRNITFGFQAIGHRYRVLGGEPAEIHENNLVDLSSLFIDVLGRGYIPHHRMPNLVEKNKISKKEFLNGEQEAKAFENREYVKLHQSTLRKVDVFATLAARLADGTIMTDARIRDIYGLSLRNVGELIKDNPLIALIVFIITVVTAIWSFIK